MEIEFHVEEESMEVFLKNMVPKIVDCAPVIRNYRGKQNLIKKLPDRLRGRKSYADDEMRIVVVMDRDKDDCAKLKRELDGIAREAGLTAKKHAGVDRRFIVLNRIAIEELESWFFGDCAALRQAYPRIPSTFVTKNKNKNPDMINDAAEALDEVLKRNGYRKGLEKIRTSEKVSKHMNPDVNTSNSFQVFRDGLKELASQ